MNDIAIGTTLGFLILLQSFLVYECLRMKSTVGTHSSDLKTEMGTIGELLDEALDFLNDIPPQPTGIVANTLASPDIKEMLLGALMNKMMMPPSDSDGSTKSTQERKILQIEETNLTEDEI